MLVASLCCEPIFICKLNRFDVKILLLAPLNVTFDDRRGFGGGLFGEFGGDVVE
jgi:hypothetical protein